eukprot:CAMPEP_0177310310 /NCGR_PEP_ID=MMETSP0368-20130122/9768_1 /TAXON_ID=447022 ORGANISM="Scrippsiella hangoei-like, Strain SHHI-4" /NCGR_SAMPLE_ID=MMETSP0368 /ASSEMBLY_ACC=CAM_ASM_000363 /LENGTH=109 /DNA_ID=CAMNT_0018769255 /DNA_START=178 /DNA_END=504 /DNA_ORIENTATION=-
MPTRQLSEIVVELKIAQAHSATRLHAAVSQLLSILDERHALDDGGTGSSGLWRWLLTLPSRRKGVVEDDQGHEQPSDGREDDGQGQPVEARARLAIGGVQEPDHSQDEP